MSTRRSRFLQYKLVAPFSGSNGRRISDGILLTFPDTIDSLREMMLGCRIGIGFERVMLGFDGVGSIGVGCRGPLPGTVRVRDALGVGCWGISPGSCGCRDI